ncbi:hypothetical protein EAI48_26460, partial [Escherichia coli]
KKTAPDGAVSGMPAIRETGPGKNLQAITVSTDELAPTRQLKVIRPELVKNPDSQLVVAFNERLA